MGPVGATRSGGCGTRLPEGWAAQLTSQKSSYWGARVPVAIGRIGLMTPSASLPRKMAVVLGAETFVVIVLLALAGSDLPPPVGFVVMIPVGLLLGVAVGAATVPLLRRIDREGAVRALLTSVLGGAAIGAGLGADREHRAGRDRLDEVGAMVEQVRCLCRRLFGRRRDTQPHVGGQFLVRNDAVEFAAAFRNGEISAGDPHARAGYVAALDRITQRDIGQPPVGADIADAREARFERNAGVAGAFGWVSGFGDAAGGVA